MKKYVLAVIIVVVFVLLTTCAGSPTSNRGSGMEGPTFIGEGGKGISLTILPPKAIGLEENQSYIPALVQGELVSNFTSFSAISVLDRLRLEEQYVELLSGWYAEDAQEGWDLGHLVPTEYIMGGSITRTTSGYTLQISVTRSTDKMTTASYSNTITIAELDNLSGVRRASLDLMQRMGVEPTAQTRTTLSGAAAANDVKAQQALSRGIAAQQGGNEFEAMFNYFEARTFNVAIPEASARITNASATLATNNFTNTGARAEVLSEIERMRDEERLRKEREASIRTLLEKATEFYKAHQPFIVSMNNTFAYSNIDHRKGTVDISVGINISPIETEMKIIRDLQQQARSIGVENWPYHVTMRVRGDKVEQLATMSLYAGLLLPVVGFLAGPIAELVDQVKVSKYNTVPSIWRIRVNYSGDVSSRDAIALEPSFNVVAEIVNERDKVLKRQSFHIKNGSTGIVHSFPFPQLGYINETFTINADDLTDILTMRIVSVNGKSTRSGYVGIEQELIMLTGTRR
jgi:hypothetical protein